MLGGAAAVALLAGISLSFGAPSFAQPSPPTPPSAPAPHGQAGDGDERRDERVIVIMRNGEGDGDHHAGAGHADGDRRADGEHRETVRTIIRTDHGDHGDHGGHATGDHDAHDGHDGQVHTFTLHRGEGDGQVRHFRMMQEGHGAHAAGADCREGNRPMVNTNEQHGAQQTRFILCGPNNMDPARQIRALERARESLASQEDLGAEGRQHALAAIDAELARLRGADR
jgi:hypothetical protein